MKLLRGTQHLQMFEKGAIATIGNFDGVHLGHQKILRSLKQQSELVLLPSLVILFEPQPREYFHKEQAPTRIYSLRDKLIKLQEYGVDFVYCVLFDKRFAQTSAEEFAKNYLFTLLNVKRLIIGEDFRFGKDRVGDVQFLKKVADAYRSQVQIFPDFCIDQQRISSTIIRDALEQGDLKKANEYLGTGFSISGKVIYGNQRGREWGIPTANINLHRLSPPISGVFVVKVKRAIDDNEIWGVANVGRRPTVDGFKNILEVHLFDFCETIYGEQLRVFFLHKLRDEVKFNSIEILIAQINQDIVVAKAFVKHLTTLQSGEQ